MANKTVSSSEKRGTKLIKNKRNSVYIEGVYTDKSNSMINIGDMVEFSELHRDIVGEIIEFHSNNIITLLYEDEQNNLLTINVDSGSVTKV